MKDKIIYRVTGLFEGKLTVPSTLYKNIGVTFIARLCSAKFVVPYVFETSVHNEYGLIVKGENGMMLITCWGFDGIILTC